MIGNNEITKTLHKLYFPTKRNIIQTFSTTNATWS